MKLFKKEPYPAFPDEWDDPTNTVFREFRLCYGDFCTLRRLVRDHMSDRGGESITKSRLLHILRDEENRAFYLIHQKRNYPRTWRIRWWTKVIRQTLHRRLKTRYFRGQVELCRIAREVALEMAEKEKQ